MALPGDRFCDECGAPIPSAAVLIVEESGWRVALPSTVEQAEIVVGREDALSGAVPDVDLGPYGADAYGVSRRHIRLVRDKTGYRVEDLGSVNLTYVNDQRLEPGRSVELQDGDRIVIGKLGLFFRMV
jgi:pSer/pThr/pTyr-binding forkhead associated (FHA) protein